MAAWDEVDAGPAVLTLFPHDRSALAALAPPEPAGVLVMLVQGLKETHPELQNAVELSGYATRIPGGFPTPEAADGVVLATMTPDGDAAAVSVLGLILAHELGHYLGLFHVTESSGLPDHIDDTDPDSQNVMDSAPNGPGLTPIQINVLRAHPALEPMLLR